MQIRRLCLSLSLASGERGVWQMFNLLNFRSLNHIQVAIIAVQDLVLFEIYENMQF